MFTSGRMLIKKIGIIEDNILRIDSGEGMGLK